MTYLSLVKAAYDYAAQSDDELTITEDTLYFVLDNSDSDWTKVRIKSDQDDEPAGLVPAAYLEVVEPISTAKALYDYEATGEGELGIKEDEPLKVYENEDEWWLVQSALPDGKLGLVPGNYVEEVSNSEATALPVLPSPRARPTSVYVDPEERVAAVSHEKLKADEIKTWGVTEIDKKGKKKKGTLGIGNGAMFFASDSDKTPVQQWPTVSITVTESEKPKHVMLEVGGSSPMVLHFNAGSKDTAEAIIEKLESSKSRSAESSAQSNSSAPSAPESVSLPTTTQVAKLKQKKSVNFSEAPEVIAPSPADDDDSYGSASEGDNAADVDAPTDDTHLATSRMDEPNAMAARAETLAIAAARTRQQQHDRGNEGTDTPRTRPLSHPPSSNAASASVPLKDRTRVWHDRTGQFRVEAEYLGMKDGKLRLHKVNGVVIEVPIEKMSPADITYIQSLDQAKYPSSLDDDAIPLARLATAINRPSSSSRSSVPPPRKTPTIDWFEFFLNAGCDVDDCTRYTAAFERDKLDEALLPDLEASTLRTLGLREGDILRVVKAIRQKYPSTAVVAAKKPVAEQAKDEHMGKKLQEDSRNSPVRTNSTSPAPKLFTGANGVLKNQRRGRPTLEPRSSSAVDIPSIASASSQIQSNTPRVQSPEAKSSTPDLPIRRSISVPPVANGFEDDAWAPRPSSTVGVKSNTLAPVVPTPPLVPALAPSSAATPRSILVSTPVPTPASAPSPANAPNLAPAPAPPTPVFTPHPAPTGPTRDILAQIHQMRPASAPLTATAGRSPAEPGSLVPPPSYRAGLGFGNSAAPVGQLLAAQRTGALSPPNASSGPRGPYAPVPANQGLLVPLIPTNTGFNSFIPARPLQVQPTGFSGGSAFQPQPHLQPQPTGFSGGSAVQSQMQPQSTSFSGGNIFQSQLSPQPTGFSGGNSFQPRLQPSLQSQPTGFQPSFANRNIFGAPAGLNNPGLQPSSTNTFQLSPQAQSGTSFDALARSAQPPPPSSDNTSPASVFASMKSGTFAAGSQAPQPTDKYEVLRSPNGLQGWNSGQGNIGLQSQPTGFQTNTGFQLGRPNGLQQNGFQANGFQPNGFQPNGFQPNGFHPQPTMYGYR